MAKHDRNIHWDDHLARPSATLLSTPLNYIYQTHLRERQVCAVIEKIADGLCPDPSAQTNIVAFLSNELPVLMKDNEDDLFPLLRRRCRADDEIEKTIRGLNWDHAHALENPSLVVTLLEELDREKRRPRQDESLTLRGFASHARRYLIVMNAIILPFARLRLSETDLENLRIRMGQRRGNNTLEETWNED